MRPEELLSGQLYHQRLVYSGDSPVTHPDRNFGMTAMSESFGTVLRMAVDARPWKPTFRRTRPWRFGIGK
jgi:hypothetical protein